MLVTAQRPADVAQAAGAWLGARLAGDGFSWAASARKLERRDGGRRELIFLQNSRWNRTGVQIVCEIVLNVWDRDLADWRLANSALTLKSTADDWLCGHPLGTLSGRGADDCVDPLIAHRRRDELEKFVWKVQGVIVAWFATTNDPETLVDAVPMSPWICMSPV